MKTFRNASIALALLVSTCSFMQAQTFVGTLSGANENPPNASPGTGFAMVTINLATHVLTIQVDFSNLTANVSAAHVHAPAGPGVNAGVATQTPSFVGFPAATSGSYTMSFDMLQASTWNATYINNNGGTPAGAEAAFANALNNGMAYFNIHTANFPGGEIRANLAIPEPSTTALLGVGLIGAAVAWRRRRARASSLALVRPSGSALAQSTRQ